MKKTYFLIFLVNAIFAGEAPAKTPAKTPAESLAGDTPVGKSSSNISSSSTFKPREKAIIKLLAVLPAILSRPDLGCIEIKPNSSVNGFMMDIFYQAKPEASFETIAQQSSEQASKTLAHPITQTASCVVGFEKKKSIQRADLGDNVGAGLCQCSRCEYTRKN